MKTVVLVITASLFSTAAFAQSYEQEMYNQQAYRQQQLMFQQQQMQQQERQHREMLAQQRAMMAEQQQGNYYATKRQGNCEVPEIRMVGGWAVGPTGGEIFNAGVRQATGRCN